MSEYKSGESFVDHLYQELINSEEVKKAIKRKKENPKNREESIKYYMERMEQAHNTPRKIKLLKSFYYRKYVIDHLPENYVTLQWRIAREEGQGNIEITEEDKKRMLLNIQEGQKRSIDSWIEYLNSEELKYPMWFKYYVFQGILKLGKFDKEKKKFRKRTKDTISPFIEINSEVISKIYTILSKMIFKKDLTENERELLNNGESFKNFYTTVLIELEENRLIKRNEIKGKWVKYEQGNNYQSLLKSLQGKNTGWCIASEQMCREYLKSGDIYIYYTYDENKKPTEPRIAIKMNGQSRIAEVRGIDKEQNLEPKMIEIADSKLIEFPNNERIRYRKKMHDMKLLTLIEKKTNNSEQLTEEELIFLYELKTDIKGFGWNKDPRIEEIISKRNPKEDFKRINTDVIIKGIRWNISILKYVPLDHSNYKEIVLSAIKQDADAIQYIPRDYYETIAIESNDIPTEPSTNKKEMTKLTNSNKFVAAIISSIEEFKKNAKNIINKRFH